jgi:hypothetical protein
MNGTTQRTATELAIDILNRAIRDIYSTRELTIRQCDAYAWRIRRAIENLKVTAAK